MSVQYLSVICLRTVFLLNAALICRCFSLYLAWSVQRQQRGYENFVGMQIILLLYPIHHRTSQNMQMISLSRNNALTTSGLFIAEVRTF